MPFPPDETSPFPLPLPDAAGPATFTAAEAEADAQLVFRRYERPPWPRSVRYALHLLLFLVTLLTTTLAGVTLVRNQFLSGSRFFLPFDLLAQPLATAWATLKPGLWYAGPFLAVLTVHEFGHYFTARYNRIRVTLPYFIPLPMGFGTFGAVIRIKEQIYSRREFFDVGLAGPLAGFLVAVGVLVYGFTHLPPMEYLYQIHSGFGTYTAGHAPHDFMLGQPLLFQALAALLADPARMPHPNELLHYPVLVAGVFSLFFTALNLLPIGQLDGGHIVYGLLGPHRAARVSLVLFVGFIFYAGLGLFSLRTAPDAWLYWSGPYATLPVAGAAPGRPHRPPGGGAGSRRLAGAGSSEFGLRGAGGQPRLAAVRAAAGPRYRHLPPSCPQRAASLAGPPSAGLADAAYFCAVFRAFAHHHSIIPGADRLFDCVILLLISPSPE